MKKLILIAGLCSLENYDITYKTAKFLKDLTDQYPEIDFIFKASYDKANRTSEDSYRGVGISKGLEIFGELQKELNIKILTDVHSSSEPDFISSFEEGNIYALQIPAFLCRQTDIVKAVGKTGKLVNIKKGQFLAPEDIRHIIKKIESTGNNKIMITERGTCFGYHNLVVDYRSFMIMKNFGYPIIFDATHSQQKPSQGNETGGTTEFVIPMAKGAIATGAIDGIFIECHPNPSEAKSDKYNTLNFKQVKQLLKEIIPIWRLINRVDTKA